MVTSDCKPMPVAEQNLHQPMSEAEQKLDQQDEVDIEGDQIEELQAVFDTFDENHDGKISSGELRRSMAKLGFNITEQELMAMMGEMDKNQNGFLEFDEFACLYRSIQSEGKLKFSADRDQDLWDAFCVFDRNQDGFITAPELQYVFSSLGIGKGMALTDFVNMIKGVDEDGDGQVNFPEFKFMMNKKLISANS